jgi:hypothetical protein
MLNIIQAYVEIQGTRPLLLNKFGPDSIPLIKGERGGVAGNDPSEWKKRICWTEKKQLFLEAPTVFACIRDGGKHTKKGRGNLQPDIVATVQVCEDIVLLDRFLPEGELGTDPTAPVYCDARGVRMSRGCWNVRYRVAASPGWHITFHVIWDKTIVSRNQLHAVCIDAGRYVGIGDGRKIGFGRFEVTKFEVTDAANETAPGDLEFAAALSMETR